MTIDNRNFIDGRIRLCGELLHSLDLDHASEFAEMVLSVRDLGNKIIFAGNGASNTIANHAALDYMTQIAARTVSITEPAMITAFANDFGYERAFERYVQINHEPGDLFVCISSSGESENIIRAARYVADHDGCVVSFTGFKPDSRLAGLSSLNFYVSSPFYNVVECIHNLWLAAICDLLTDWMGDQAGTHGYRFDD